MHGTEIFMQLSVLMILAAVVALLAKQLKQPLILSYIVSGLLAGTALPALLNWLGEPPINTSVFDIFSSLGIAFLLFIIGTELSLAVFKRLGATVLVIALNILLVIGGAGYLIARATHFTVTEAIIIGLALFFSSTIIIVKVLSDKKEGTRLHGKIAIGVVLIDDIVATLALLYVTAGRDGFSAATLGILAAKGIAIGVALGLVAVFVLPKLIKKFASNQELLFLFTIAWGLGIASLFQYFGFSIEIGALFAGVSLASLPYSQEMASRLKPLRDFFIVIFFITLGAGLNLGELSSALLPAIILSLVVIIGKPLVVMLSMRPFHHTKRTAFKTGINISQISEFSIILVAVAISYGLVSSELSALITLVALITIAVSTYLVKYDTTILRFLARHFKMFHDSVDNQEAIAEQHSLFLFGYRRGGVEFIRTFKSLQKKFLIVDYDPDIIETLKRQNLPFVYGDATDTELLDEIGLKHGSLAVSTITNFRTTEYLLRYVKQVNPEITFICHAEDLEESAALYELGASYVMLPHYLGSEHIGKFIREHGVSAASLKTYRQDNIFNLGRTAIGKK